MKQPEKRNVEEILAALGINEQDGGRKKLVVTSPVNGRTIYTLECDDADSLAQKATSCEQAGKSWALIPYPIREAFLRHLSEVVKKHAEALATLITYEGGKVPKESEGEVGNISATIDTTIKNAAAKNSEETNRTEWHPVGVVGLITSYNFPLAVAGWTIAPAILAGDGVMWKPSEKTPLTALAFQAIFRQAAAGFNAAKSAKIIDPDLLQVVVGERDVGKAMVEDERVSMISATGSVGMGKGIEKSLSGKTNNKYEPILELGGNNAMVISDKNDDIKLEFAVDSILKSVFATGGQRCTNTRRVIVHEAVLDKVKALFEKRFREFIASGAIANTIDSTDHNYMYAPLIDKDSYDAFERAKDQVTAEGGQVLFGGRQMESHFADAYYVEPALALLPSQTQIMHHETFAPILFIAPYKGGIDNAIAMVNAPGNAGLVNGIYTQDAAEEAVFIRGNLAGHSVINSPKGTGTPAHGQGFGGNRDSGKGVILSPDPLAPFTVEGQAMLASQRVDREEVTEPKAGTPATVFTFRVMRPNGAKVTRVAKFQ